MVLPCQYETVAAPNYGCCLLDEGDLAKEFYSHLKDDFEEAEDNEQVNHVAMKLSWSHVVIP